MSARTGSVRVGTPGGFQGGFLSDSGGGSTPLLIGPGPRRHAEGAIVVEDKGPAAAPHVRLDRDLGGSNPSIRRYAQGGDGSLGSQPTLRRVRRYPDGAVVVEDSRTNTPKRAAASATIRRKESGDDEHVVLNVGGVRHETHVSTLRLVPGTRLAKLAETHSRSRSKKEEYFFDRHPAVFNAIIDFYRTGELHVPLEVCGAVVKRELDFWQINEYDIKACCFRHYRSYIENQRILDSFNDSLNKEAKNVDLRGLSGWNYWHTKIWLILEYPRTSKAAMMYGVTSFLFVMFSIAGFCLETLPALRPIQNVTTPCENDVGEAITNVMTSHEALYILDMICTVFFTAELILRFIFAPNRLRFVRSLMNIIDLLALVPLYVQVIFQRSDLQACYLDERLVIEIMFLLRIVRMFRIFHLVKHYQALKVLVYALKASLQELLMLFIFLLIGMLCFSTMIYYAERKDATSPSDTFNTIPVGFWWAIITMTTVGYGDLVPKSPIGYVVGTGCAVAGVLLVALTIPVISNNFTLFYRHIQYTSQSDSPKRLRRLMNCSRFRTLQCLRRQSGSSTSVEPYMNGGLKDAATETTSRGLAQPVHQSSRVQAPAKRVYEQVVSFSEANSLTNVRLRKQGDSDPDVSEEKPLRAYSEDNLVYKGESVV